MKQNSLHSKILERFISGLASGIRILGDSLEAVSTATYRAVEVFKEKFEMCEYCKSDSSTHPSGCPNAPEPKEIHTCKVCEESIVEGEEYVDLPVTGIVCYDCLWDFMVGDWLEEMGVCAQVAEVEE